ncbi:hypothetical protein PENANT_c037G03895 [Penicillium antarcticum]|uniref:Uncharacterized protein n=1 Tax=Penicillium antarcticum TaxID=416450 RepID=A0A1V6PU95_9EURO|nr:hypothetical protein PENANT_c037G03895 [Penicillium antarcticum]
MRFKTRAATPKSTKG